MISMAIPVPKHFSIPVTLYVPLGYKPLCLKAYPKPLMKMY